MKDKVLGYLMLNIKKKKYNDEQLSIIKYGLESIYIFISKTIFIFTVALLLGIFKEVLIFTLLYNLIRMPSFGLHATKSWMCLLSSTIIFIVVPYLCFIYTSSFTLRAVIGVIVILLIYKNSPADTYKRPIVSAKRRNKFKFISSIITILMVYVSLIIDNSFIQNALIMSLVVQCFMISPMVYKLFKLPYNNYKTYKVMS